MNETSTSNNISLEANSTLIIKWGRATNLLGVVLVFWPLFGSGVARHIPKLGSICAALARPTPAECLRLHP